MELLKPEEVRIIDNIIFKGDSFKSLRESTRELIRDLAIHPNWVDTVLSSMVDVYSATELARALFQLKEVGPITLFYNYNGAEIRRVVDIVDLIEGFANGRE